MNTHLKEDQKRRSKLQTMEFQVQVLTMGDLKKIFLGLELFRILRNQIRTSLEMKNKTQQAHRGIILIIQHIQVLVLNLVLELEMDRNKSSLHLLLIIIILRVILNKQLINLNSTWELEQIMSKITRIQTCQDQENMKLMLFHSINKTQPT